MSYADELEQLSEKTPAKKYKSEAAELSTISTQPAQTGTPETPPEGYVANPSYGIPVGPGENVPPKFIPQYVEPSIPEKIRAAIETTGGTISSAVASIPAIPYGIYNAIKNTTEGKKPDLENELFGAIKQLTPDVLMPHSELGQKYMQNVGEALAPMPILGPEVAGGAVAGSRMAAQFGRAKAGAVFGGKEPIAVAPLTKASQDKGIHNINYELHQKIANAEQNGTVNPIVAQRHIATEQLPEVISEEDGRPIKMHLSEGDATQDSAIWSNERNERSMSPAMRQRIKDNAEAPPLILDYFKKQVAPNTSFSSVPEAGQHVIGKLQGVRDQLKGQTAADYNAAFDAYNQSGFKGSPIDVPGFIASMDSRLQSERMLTKHLARADLPPEIRGRLEGIESGEIPMTFGNYENFRTILGEAQRDASRLGNGMQSKALGIVRDELEHAPLTPEAQQIKPLFDKARASAKLDFDMQKASPAYRAVVEGDARPDNFIQNYIFGKNKNTGVNELQNLLNLFPDDKDFHQTLAYLRLDDIKREASTANGRITASKLNAALAKGEDRGMDRMLFDEKILPFPINHGLENLRKAVNWTTVAPAGNYVQGNPHIIRQVGNYIGSGMGTAVNKVLNWALPGNTGNLITKGFESAKYSLQRLNTKSTEIGAGLDYKSTK